MPLRSLLALLAALPLAGPPLAAQAPATPAAATAPAARVPDSPIVRGIYVNRFAAQSSKRMKQLIALADATEINAFVIDIKDEFGANYKSADPVVQRNAGRAGSIGDLRGLLDTLKAHKILAIARIVTFKDSVTARVNPQWTIRKADGSTWRDKQGLAWVNPYHRELWDYNVRIAEEVVRMGFGEVQFDYIRFPEPYKSLPPQVFPDSRGLAKPEALAEFLAYARGRISKLGVRTTADVFGLVTTLSGALEVGQQWESLSPHADVLLPMVYPSHYPRGAFNVARPNAEPYKIVFAAINRARERDAKLGIRSPEHVRAWLQAFSLGQPEYGPAEIRAQKQAVYDAGYDSWVLWHPGSKYEAFVPGLDKDLVAHKRTPVPRAARK
ncbi:MAG: putative glycoside hydrolase [Gemmatimonadaceae bacterium]